MDGWKNGRYYSGPEDLDVNSIKKQIKESHAKVVICNERSAKKTQEAISAVEIETERKIHLFSFGPVEGIDNILSNLEDIDEINVSDPVVIE